MNEYLLPLTVIRCVFSADRCFVPNTRHVYRPVSLKTDSLMVSIDFFLVRDVRIRIRPDRRTERRPNNHLNLISTFSLELYLQVSVMVVPVRTNSILLKGSVIASPPVGFGTKIVIVIYKVARLNLGKTPW